MNWQRVIHTQVSNIAQERLFLFATLFLYAGDERFVMPQVMSIGGFWRKDVSVGFTLTREAARFFPLGLGPCGMRLALDGSVHQKRVIRVVQTLTKRTEARVYAYYAFEQNPSDFPFPAMSKTILSATKTIAVK